MRRKVLAVIGTDTEVGKTITCALLLAYYGRRFPLAYWKPVATGSAETTDSQIITEVCGSRIRVLPEAYLFEPPVSPHLAARWAGQEIDPGRIHQEFLRHCESLPGHGILVEGIGGLLVPLRDDGYLLADLLAELNLSCLLASSSRVGTINHTLLTLEAARSRKIPVAGVILNGPPDSDNREAIESFGQVPVVGEIPPLGSPRALAMQAVADVFQPRPELDRLFQGLFQAA